MTDTTDLATLERICKAAGLETERRVADILDVAEADAPTVLVVQPGTP